ncbi:hypothetical protein [Actinocatenispora comari]|uniref:Uncharacterized protein n=1 Tax=Actinocatenispora comari TaxID=2807577 RepID=A0A8J4ADM3_9ACTN|nr:hypothetical protein [Actinocatenispora comari]GIL29113.1 hypothetical protein NUM_43670 [Actinocatenispora comari]
MTHTDTDLAELVHQITDTLATAFTAMAIADEEIDRAAREHPADADLLYHALTLLVPTHSLMATGHLLRAHCRELLRRVVNAEDTRPGTAAEVCCVCHDISLATPLSSPAVGLYMRMWTAAGLPSTAIDTGDAAHHETLEAERIDELEADTRRRLAVADRHLSAVSCTGSHHGRTVSCRFAEVHGD